MKRLALCLLVLLFGFNPAAGAGEVDSARPGRVLIEYSSGDFDETGPGLVGPFLQPPEIRIYKSGQIVFLKERGVWTGQVEKRRFEKLLRTLAQSELLRKSQVLPVKRGDSLGFHGGMAYFLYQGGREEVIAAVLLAPRHGPWRRMLNLLRSCLPSTYRSFVPSVINVRVRPGGSLADSVPWPFQEILSLRKPANAEARVSDPRMVNFVLRHLARPLSWSDVVASEDGSAFTLTLESVPGWFEPEDTRMWLGVLASDAMNAP
jgi:hypothetical protein